MIAAAHTPTIEYIAAWATLGTAIGTIGLATATFVLAGKTQRLAQSGQETADAAKEELVLLRTQTDAAQRQSRAAEEALNASVVPVLLDIPRHTMFQLPKNILERLRYRSPLGPPGPSEIDLSIISANDSATFPSLVVPVRNVGAGVALGLAAAVTIEAIGTPIVRGEPPSAIAVGGHGHVWFGGSEERLGEAGIVLDPNERARLRTLLLSGQDLIVEIAYSDVSGRQEAAAALYLTRSGTTDRAYRVTRVEPRIDRQFTAGWGV